MSEPRGWYSRGYLPHIDAGRVPQFITWRLADSLPAELYRTWKHELERTSDAQRKQELYKRTERYLDEGHGSQLLAQAPAALAMQETLLHDHGRHYDLEAWVVMPTHVHTLLIPYEHTTLGKVLQVLKGVSSLRINRALGRGGQLWQEDYFDRAIRDEKHFNRVAEYIEWNPVKAKLCTDPRRWPYSSASKAGRCLIGTE